MVATYAPNAAKRFQWESSAAPSQSWNCGPTCVTQIAQFYKDRWYGIEATRRLVAASYSATTAWQQRDMLIRRGVSASVRYINSVGEIHGLVDSGRRPIVIGMVMGRVPVAYRDHPFTGWHAVVVLGRAVVNGVVGFWVTDPNFSPSGGVRPDPDRGRKFYPDWVIQHAFINNSPRYSVVPTYWKAIPAPTSTRKAWNREMKSIGVPFIRASPGGAILGKAYVGQRFLTKEMETAGPTYNDWRDGKLRRDWVILRDGRCIAKAFLVTVRIL